MAKGKLSNRKKVRLAIVLNATWITLLILGLMFCIFLINHDNRYLYDYTTIDKYLEYIEKDNTETKFYFLDENEKEKDISSVDVTSFAEKIKTIDLNQELHFFTYSNSSFDPVFVAESNGQSGYRPVHFSLNKAMTNIEISVSDYESFSPHSTYYRHYRIKEEAGKELFDFALTI